MFNSDEIDLGGSKLVHYHIQSGKFRQATPRTDQVFLKKDPSCEPNVVNDSPNPLRQTTARWPVDAHSMGLVGQDID